MRRGVVSGSVLQGMALTVPIGGLSFLVLTLVFGELHHLVLFPMAALAWLARQGVVHFVVGRYCNYKSNQLMGVNLTQAMPGKGKRTAPVAALGPPVRSQAEPRAPEPIPTFQPRIFSGYLLGLGA